MHDRLFANQKALGPDDLPSHAQTIGLDLAEFQRCLESERSAAAIRKDIADGQKAGVRSTPTFLLGVTKPDDSEVKVMKLLRGARVYQNFKSVIENALSSQKQ